MRWSALVTVLVIVNQNIAQSHISQYALSSSFLELEHELEMMEGKKDGKEIPMQENFLAKCFCGRDVTFFPHLLLPFDRIFGCAATKVTVTQLDSGWEIVDGEDSWGRPMQYKIGYGMNADQIQRAFGNPLQQKWAKASIHHVSDFSGRAEAPILATPGGDIAQFVLALNAYMAITETKLENPDCQNLLQGFLDKSSKASFYFPTDSKAIEMLSGSLNMATIDLTQRPDDKSRDKILNLLVHPLYQGSAIMRMMLQRPQTFKLHEAKNTNIAECAIRAFFNILWDTENPTSKKMRLVELDGDDLARAIVKVYASLPCEAMSMMPLITPMSDQVCDNNGCKKQMYTIHPQVPIIMHEELSDFLSEKDNKIKAEEMRAWLKADSAHVEALAVESVLYPTERKKLPVYKVLLS